MKTLFSLLMFVSLSAQASTSCEKIHLTPGTYEMTLEGLPMAPRFVKQDPIPLNIEIIDSVSRSNTMKEVVRVYSIRSQSTVNDLDHFNYAFLAELDEGCFLYLVNDQQNFNWDSIWKKYVLYYGISKTVQAKDCFDMRDQYDGFKKVFSKLVKVNRTK